MLDRQRLLGEHAELHVLVNAVLKLKKGIKGGWQRHPQTLRFVSHLGMLGFRHRQQVAEIERRGYRHNSPLPSVGKFEPYDYSFEEFVEDYELLKGRLKSANT